MFLFSVFNKKSYELLKTFQPRIVKVASRTVVDSPDLVKEIINKQESVIISLGMWNKSKSPLPFESKKIYYLWCESKYPCTPWDMKNFPKQFSPTAFSGYSDHTIGIETCLLAISRGARIIEKHFTLDKSDVTIRDHALSTTPEEFLQLSRLGKDIFKKLKIGV